MLTNEMEINAPTHHAFANAIYNNSDDSGINSNRNDGNAISRETSLSNNSSINIYRYKFTQDFMDDLHKFSKIHQYDDRKGFKEAWESWIIDNDEIVQEEMERLENLNYDGDVLDKMFKSARYYFKKKSSKKPEPKDRRQYLSVQKDLLDAMDEHILKKMKEQDYKPSDGFTDFCKSSLELLKDEVTRLVVEHGVNDVNMIKEKIKKTYKNRYFIFASRKT
jgi:hypothetical protein